MQYSEISNEIIVGTNLAFYINANTKKGDENGRCIE
jgi:hypothetical protein